MQHSGDQVLKTLQRVGICKDGRPHVPDIERLELLLGIHCVVIQGHLATRAWPRLFKISREHAPAAVCSCHTFLMHAECEHVLFVRALQGDAAVNLHDIPEVRAPGRPRKRQSATQEASKPKRLKFS